MSQNAVRFGVTDSLYSDPVILRRMRLGAAAALTAHDVQPNIPETLGCVNDSPYGKSFIPHFVRDRPAGVLREHFFYRPTPSESSTPN